MASGLRAVYPGISPEIAFRHLQTSQGSDCSGVGGADQIRRLEQWLRAEGLCVPKAAFAGGFVGSGAEHETYIDIVGGFAVKLTHDGRFGHCLRREGAVSTPMDYLRRLAWHNELFGDDIVLHGLLENSAGLRLVSSQPWIISNPARLTPTQDDIDAFLADFGFTRSRRYPDGFIYFNAEAGLVIGDAQPTNLLLDETGTIRPIDLVIAEPEENFRLKLTSADC
jgi:hypothetical protein